MNLKKKTGTIYLKPKKKSVSTALNEKNNKKSSHIPKIVGCLGVVAFSLLGLRHNNSKNPINDYLGKISQTYKNIKAVEPSVSIEYGQNNFLNDVYKIKKLMIQQAAKSYINRNNKWKEYLKTAFVLDRIGNPSANSNEIIKNMGYYLKNQDRIIGFDSNKELIFAVKNLLSDSEELKTNLKLLKFDNQERNLIKIQKVLKKILEELNRTNSKERKITGLDI